MLFLSGLDKKVRRFIDIDIAKSLIHALVISRLDYYNSIYIGLPKHPLQRLQLVMNTAARMIFGLSFRERISPYLEKLHWLPVQQRIEFKVLTVAFNSVHGTGPSYLNNPVGYMFLHVLFDPQNSIF